MDKRQFIIIVIVIAVTAGVGGFYAQQWWLTGGTLVRIDNNVLSKSDSKNISSETSKNDKRPDFTLMDLENKPRSISEWDGKVILINFWATWCPPCVREVPTLDKLNTDFKDKGFVVIGIAIDSLDAVQDFVDPLDLQYPLLLAEQQGIELSQAYGNRLGILPFSVVIDRQGKMVIQQPGEVSYQQVEAFIKPLF